jgi:hypothetical protein
MARLVRRGLLVAGLLVLVAIGWVVAAYARPAAAGRGHRGGHRPTARLHAGQAEAFRVWTQTSGVTDVVHMYIDPSSAVHTVAVGIYSNADGHPGSLLSRGSEPYPQAQAWGEVPVAPLRLRAGRTYWLAVLGEGGTLRYRNRRPEPCLSDLSVRTHLRELPRRWGTGRMRARTHCPIVAYVAADPVRFLTPPVTGSTASPSQPSPSLPSLAAALPPPEAMLPSPEGPSSPPTGPVVPAAPTNEAPPTISGTAEAGETLAASPGAWTESPTSYAYQWEDCNSAGEACSEVRGATSSSYRLTASDVGHTVVVVVTASNAGGSTPTASSPTAVVAAEQTAPTNEVPPSISGYALVGEKLTASPGEWTGHPMSPFAYQWEDCNAEGGGCSEITGAKSQTYTLIAGDVGHTIRVVVTASNASGSTPASSEVTAVVVAQTPAAPTNETVPTISGSAVEGQTLTASHGTWSGSPTSYAYQWEDCNAAGNACAEISGATASTRKLASGDVGHTLRVVVKATNAGGTGKATSAATGTVTAKEKVKEEKPKEGTPKDCFENPETEGTSRFETCGYPGPKDTGVAETSGKTECSALPKSVSGDKTITKAETIEDTDITGQVTVDASGVTLDKDCIVYDGHEASGSSAVILEAGASDFTIADTTVRAENDAADSFEEAISNDSNAAGASASKDRLEDCGECLHQEWSLTKSYVIANGQRVTEETDPGEVHREDWYCNDNTIAAEGNTMLNPYDQTAVIFCDTNLGGGGACSDHVTATGNLLAGSGYMLYPCGNSSSAGTSTMTVKDNRFARCLGATKYESGTGGTACADGADANGYWPYGGYFGAATSYYTGAGQVWEGNYWDDDLAAVEP